jgi:hypothetical protein
VVIKNTPVGFQKIGGLKFLLSEIVLIDYNRYGALFLPVLKNCKISGRFKVLRGSAIDIFLVDEKNFYCYAAGRNFSYYEIGSALNTKYKTVRFAVKTEKIGKYFFIFDNTFQPTGGAQPDLFTNNGRIELQLDITMSITRQARLLATLICMEQAVRPFLIIPTPS